jgi:hypothetical protein
LGALACEAVGADRWHVAHTVDLVTHTPIVTASIARELPSAASPSETKIYRLVASCNASTGEGQILLAWARTVSLIMDGAPQEKAG